MFTLNFNYLTGPTWMGRMYELDQTEVKEK